jgi:hypothetical protein
MNPGIASRDPVLGREATYALRREMIRRLQESTAGLPRGERSRQLREFAQGWQELAERVALGALAALLAQGGSVPAQGIPLILRSLAARSSVEAGSRETARDPELEMGDGSIASWQKVGTCGSPRPDIQTWWAPERQGDLFPAGLMVQPL